MSQPGPYNQKALSHIRYLSVTVGGRGSCTPQERRAAEYTAEQMRQLGVSDVQLAPFQGSPSKYRPYALALGLAVIGTLLMWFIDTPWALATTALLKVLAAWGILAASDCATNWMRWVLPKAGSQNATGVILPAGQVGRRLVLSAHLDTHRTPAFYASGQRLRLFRLLMIGAWVAMVIEAVFYGLAIAFAWDWVFWIGALSLLQVVVLDLCLAADRTPFSPGANDNASGVGVALGLAQRLKDEPLAHTEVWLAFTGSQETASDGMAAFLEAHAAELGDDAIYLALENVGHGRLNLPTIEGQVIKHRIHPQVLDLARRVGASLPNLQGTKQAGPACSGAALATKRGRIALTVSAAPARDGTGISQNGQGPTRWHTMSDTWDGIDPQSLADVHAFAWQLLQEVDRS